MRKAILIAGIMATGSAAFGQGARSNEPSRKEFGVIGAPAGTGKSPAVAEARADFPSHTLFRPAKLPRARLPLVLWGNGACRDNGLQHAQFLREVASHGYFVIALGVARKEIPTVVPGAPPAPPPPPTPRATQDETQLSQMAEAIDWAKTGAYAKHIDSRRIAVMGHSCGGLQAIAMSADPRVATSVIFNSGVYNRPGEGRSNIKVGKEALDRLHGPIAYFAGGPSDIAHVHAADDVSRITKVPVFFGELQIGHNGTFWTDPNGGDWARVATGWLNWRLKRDGKAGRMFAGASCGLCLDPRWTVVRKGL